MSVQVIVQTTCALGGTLIIQMDRGFTCLRLQHLGNTASSIWQGKGGLGVLSMGSAKSSKMTHLCLLGPHGGPQVQGGQEVQSP